MKIRLFVTENILDLNQKYLLNKTQSHYLKNVLRLKTDSEIFIFNNKDGEFKAKIIAQAQNNQIEIIQKTQSFYKVANINLAFTPVKKIKAEYLVTKATELGVQKIQPILTSRSIVNKVNHEKLILNCIEAAEQSRRTDLPKINKLCKLNEFLANLTNNDILILADESGQGLAAQELFKHLTYDKNNNYYILIGPEGGFSEQERKLIKNYKHSHSMILGPRILRSDTAIISALSLMQNYLGDMNLFPSF